jgi:hypothetical protein
MDNDNPIQNPFNKDDNRPITLPDEYQTAPAITSEKQASKARTNPWITGGIVVIATCCLLVASLAALPMLATSPLVAQYFPSETPSITPAPTITSTPTPNATATQRVIQTATAQGRQTATAQVFQATATASAGQWPILVSDPFDANNNDWPVGTNKDEYGKLTREIKEGKYHWDWTAYGNFIERVRIDTEPLTNFYITIEAAQISGSRTADYGLTFRVDPYGNLYYFGINEDKQFLIARLYDNKWSSLIDWTFSPAILADKPNRLTVIANSDDFIVFINNQFVAEFHDDKIRKGRTALAAELHLEDAQAVFEFDNVELRVPQP